MNIKEQVNLDPEGIIKNIRCFALDMDGTIYLGTKWIEGAGDFLRKVEESGRTYFFLTNNSSKDPSAYVEKLDRMGLKISRDRLITSGDATIDHIKKHYPGKKVYLLGNSLLRRQFSEAGIELVPDDVKLAADTACAAAAAGGAEAGTGMTGLPAEAPGLVVVGFDTELDYEKMCIVCDYVRAGIPYISTHPDYNCPTETGFVPDAGAIHAFIEASTGHKPDLIIGKPNSGIADYLLSRTGFERSEIAMVGDRLYTDVKTGVNNGMTGVMVLSGEAQLDDLDSSDVIPDLIFDSVKEIIRFL